MSNADEPAYPADTVIYREGDGTRRIVRGGMTIRQRFVMAAMQGLCADPNLTHMSADCLAIRAIDTADATLAAMEKGS